MSGPVIIRLQNLPLEARTLDIRRFFEGLSIPDGGVHIIGGEKGDAFIAFNSDEDARQAMARDSQLLCGVRIRLLLSSKTEMHTVISAARTGTTVPAVPPKPPVYVTTAPVATAPATNNDLLSSLTKLISSNNNAPTMQQQQQQPQQTNLLDQLKTLFPSSASTAGTVVNTSPNSSYSAKPANLPPALADIFNKTVQQTAPVANNQYYDPNKAAAQQQQQQQQHQQNYYAAQQAQVVAPAQPAAANPLLNQVNINQLLSLLSSSLNPGAPAATVAQPVQQPPIQQLQQQLPSLYANNQPQQQQQQQQQQYQHQQPSYQTAATQGGYKNYYQSAQSYKQDQSSSSSSSNRPSNDYQSYSSSSNNNRYDSNNGRNNDNYRNGNGNKRYEQYTDRFSSRDDRRYSRDDDDRGRRNGGGGRSQLDPIIRVRNFNTNCSYKDIRTFLQGIQIEHDGIKLITDANGSRTGMAYVKLCTIIDLKKALCRNGQYFDTNSIEVVQSTQHEFGSIDNFYQKNKSNYNSSYQSSTSRQQDDYYPDDMQSNSNNGDGDDRHYNQAPVQQQQHQRQADSAPVSRYNTNNTDENAPNGYYLKIIGLPTRFDRQSLQNEFNNVKFMRIQTIYKHELGRPMLIVEVETKLDLERALTRHNEKVNKQKIQVFEITKGEFEEELNLYHTNRRNKERNGGAVGSDGFNKGPRRHFNDDSNEGEDVEDEPEVLPPEDQDPNDICVYLSGVPFSARTADVNFFFQDMNLLKVSLLQDPQTFKATGECCCMFKTKEDRDRAINEKDDQLFRGRVVKIKPISYSEYQEYIVNRKKSGKRSGYGRPLLHTPMNADDRPKLMDENGNNSNGDDDNDQQDDDEDEDQQQQQQQHGDDRDYEDHQQQDDESGDPRGARGRHGGYQSRRGFRGGGNNFGGYKRRANNSQSPLDFNSDIKRSKPSAELPPLPPELAGLENLVLLRNVSHKATRDNIIEMLRQYNANEQTLKVRQYDDGKPTGEAIVAFHTRDDVASFVQQMNGSDFMGRALRITEVN